MTQWRAAGSLAIFAAIRRASSPRQLARKSHRYSNEEG
jgi:hypothetical protein